MLLGALRSELERNMEVADTTRRLVKEERDMLQADITDRLVLHRFHTDVWDTYVNSGNMTEIGSGAAAVSNCYARLKEINELITMFAGHGNPIVYAPLFHGTREGYGRDEVIDIIRRRCDAVQDFLRDALQVVGERIDRICPVCGETFDSRTGMKSHITQKSDEEHRQYAIDL